MKTEKDKEDIELMKTVAIIALSVALGLLVAGIDWQRMKADKIAEEMIAYPVQALKLELKKYDEAVSSDIKRLGEKINVLQARIDEINEKINRKRKKFFIF